VPSLCPINPKVPRRAMGVARFSTAFVVLATAFPRAETFSSSVLRDRGGAGSIRTSVPRAADFEELGVHRQVEHSALPRLVRPSLETGTNYATVFNGDFCYN